MLALAANSSIVAMAGLRLSDPETIAAAGLRPSHSRTTLGWSPTEPSREPRCGRSPTEPSREPRSGRSPMDAELSRTTLGRSPTEPFSCCILQELVFRSIPSRATAGFCHSCLKRWVALQYELQVAGSVGDSTRAPSAAGSVRPARALSAAGSVGDRPERYRLRARSETGPSGWFWSYSTPSRLPSDPRLCQSAVRRLLSPIFQHHDSFHAILIATRDCACPGRVLA